LSKKKFSIVDAWNWFVNLTEMNILTSSEQLVLIHLIKFINKNFWKPVKLEPTILSKSTNKDNRTVKKALTMLINKGFVIQNQNGGYFIGIDDTSDDKHSNDINQPSNEVFDFADHSPDD